MARPRDIASGDPANGCLTEEGKPVVSQSEVATTLSPLDQIRQAEADLARQIAAAHEEAEGVQSRAKSQAKQFAEAKPALVTKEYRTLFQIKGPLIFVERTADIAYGEMVEIVDPDGNVGLGQVLEVDRQRCMVRVFVGTSGLDLNRTRVRFRGDIARLDVSLSMLGRALDGLGRPIDGAPPLIAESSLDINGLPINPSVRAHPSEFIQTGLSALDGMNTLARGQKLPIFSCAGLPADELAAQITARARVVGTSGGAEPSVWATRG